MFSGKTTAPFSMVLLVFSLFFITPGLHAADPVQAPINPLFLNQLDSINTSGETGKQTYATGEMESTVIPEIHDPTTTPAQIMAAATDPKYDLRDPNLDGNQTDSLVSPVKAQGLCGCCWAFATYGSLESYLIKSEDTTYDFSEDNLKHLHGRDTASCSGGNVFFSSAYLSRFSGPISESDDPYNASAASAYCTTCTPVRYVDDHIFLPARSGPADLNYLKQAILNYGALYTNMHWDDTSYNIGDDTYYYSGAEGTNHGVTLVGWDDNKVISGAPGNGAFIIKNSWGPAWGENGYFYISYYDTKTAYGWNAAFPDIDDDTAMSFNKVYYYDPLGWVSQFGYGDGDDWAANIFTPTADGVLNAVGIYLTSSGTDYEIYIYDDFNGSTFSNLLSSETGSRTYAGWYTIPLSTPVDITSGDSFGVVVRYNNGDTYDYPIAFEKAVAGLTSSATANPGESFYSNTGGTFFDLTGYESTGNCCIKAYVSEPPAPPNLVNWNGNLVADFGDNGMWYHNGTAWNWMTNDGDVGQMVAWDGKLVTDFGAGKGLWYYDGSWHWMTNKSNPNMMIAWDNGTSEVLVVDFGSGQRIYTYDGSWDWFKNKDGVAGMTVWNNKLIVDFGSGRGVYNYDGAWNWMTNKDDIALMLPWDNGTTEKLVADFGGGRRIYTYDGSWNWLKNKDDVNDMTVWNQKLVVDFGGGRLVYTYDGSWNWMTNKDDVARMVTWKDAGTDLAFDFGNGRNMYNYNGSWTWMKNANNVPEMLAWNNRLVVDFGPGVGVYNYNGSWNRMKDWSTVE